MTEKIPEFPKEIKGTQIHQIIWDEITEELKEQHNEQMIAVLIHPEVYKSMKYKSSYECL